MLKTRGATRTVSGRSYSTPMDPSPTIFSPLEINGGVLQRSECSATAPRARPASRIALGKGSHERKTRHA